MTLLTKVAPINLIKINLKNKKGDTSKNTPKASS